MSLQIEKLEKNMVKLTIEASAEDFNAAVEKAYQKNKGKINLQGFRKGKAPRAMIEKMYGRENPAKNHGIDRKSWRHGKIFLTKCKKGVEV